MAELEGQVREELRRAVAERYRGSSREAKARILDEFVALTGYHRKHAIRVLGQRARSQEAPRASRARIYDDAVKQALVVLWEASDRICGKRLKAILPLLVSALERHGHLQLDAVVRAKLMTVSASTIDRLLKPVRREAGQHHRRWSAGRRWVRPRTAYGELWSKTEVTRRFVPTDTYDLSFLALPAPIPITNPVPEVRAFLEDLLRQALSDQPLRLEHPAPPLHDYDYDDDGLADELDPTPLGR